RSAARVLHAYADLRDRLRPVPRTDAFFVTVRGSRVGHSTAEGTFLRLRERLPWPPGDGGRAPRVHDLRHTFACRRLLLWYAQGVDIDRAVHALSTYLGHTCVRDTYWYLTAVPELLALAA